MRAGSMARQAARAVLRCGRVIVCDIIVEPPLGEALLLEKQ
jgi:hypothetical protein